MSDEETEVKSFADTIKVSKSSAIKIDVTNEVNDGRISVIAADVADTNELKQLFREDIVSNMKRFREAKEEEEAMKVTLNVIYFFGQYGNSGAYRKVRKSPKRRGGP